MFRCPGALSVRALAKINLGLEVTGLAGDGYHLIRSILQVIDLGDDLTFFFREDWPPGRVNIICDDPGVPSGGASHYNLIARAARAMNPPFGIEVFLKKGIPVGAGLGGGSSDAAATLAVLSRAMHDRHPAEIEGMEEIAFRLGADVPFFLRGGTQEASGRGERLRSIPFPGSYWAILSCPPVRLSTAAVYGAYDQMEAKPRGGMAPGAIIRGLRRGDLMGTVPQIRNHLEQPALTCEPRLVRCRDRFAQATGKPVLMTGSGSSFFALYQDGEEARRAYHRLTCEPYPNTKGVRLFLCRFRCGGGWDISSDGGGSVEHRR